MTPREVTKLYCGCGAALTVSGDWPAAQQEEFVANFERWHSGPDHERLTEEQWREQMADTEDADLAWGDES